MRRRKKHPSSQHRSSPSPQKPDPIERVPIPNEKARAQAQAILTRIESQMHVRSESYQNMFPHPDTLAALDVLVPGTAEKVISQMLKQSNHRMSLEKTVIEGDSRRADLGVYTGAGVSLGAFILAGVFAYLGLSVEGLAVFMTALASLIGIFVYGNRVRQNERERAGKQMEDVRDVIRRRNA